MAGIVGWRKWQSRIDGFKSELESNPLWHEFLLERHGLELGRQGRWNKWKGQPLLERPASNIEFSPPRVSDTAIDHRLFAILKADPRGRR